MECSPLEVLSEGLYLDLLILFLEFRSHTGVSQVPANLHMLTNWRIAATEPSLNGFIEILFFTRCYWISTRFNPKIALLARAVIIVECIHVKTFKVSNRTRWCGSRPWYCLLSAKLLQLRGNDCSFLILYFSEVEICFTTSLYLFFLSLFCEKKSHFF